MHKILRKFKMLKTAIVNRPDTFIALSSMLVAVFALVATLNSNQRSDRIEKLRWMPLLSLDYTSNAKKGFSISIANKGLGPAEIKWVQFYYDEETVYDWDDLYNRLELPEKDIQDNLVERTFGMIYPNQVIPGDGDNSGYNLLSEANPVWNQALLENSNRIGIAICYCSLLGDCKRKTWSSAGQSFADNLEENFPSCRFDQAYQSYFHLPRSYLSN